MKATKYEILGASSSNGLPVDPKAKAILVKQKQYYNVGILTIVGVSTLMFLQGWDDAEYGSVFQDFKRMIYPLVQGVHIPHGQHWNFSSHSFQPNVSDWDEQRAAWKEEHPNPRPLEGDRPTVLMVTGSTPEECEPFMESHLLLRAAKNKLDYSRIHDMEFYYSMGNPDPEFSDRWQKLPVIRMLMLQHPEVDWIWWLDADAIFTNMTFEPPFAELEHHNLVLNGVDRLVYNDGDQTGLSTGAYMIRNCQWSLDLLSVWTEMGTAGMRDESGRVQNYTGATRLSGFEADDQSSLVALLAEDKKNPVDLQKWVPMVRLVQDAEHFTIGNWTVVIPKLEELSPEEVPFVTHFTGCLPSCAANSSHLQADSCVEQMERALIFADNQVYQRLGLQPHSLGSFSELYTLNDKHGNALRNGEAFRMLPKVTDWDKRRQVFMEHNPSAKRHDVMLTGGSSPKACFRKEGAHLLMRGFKNWIDYSRMHGIKAFYNMAVTDENLTGWWSKLPVVRMLMLNNPDTEWIWWMDSDCMFTDMNFQIPFGRYDGYNLVMYGNEHEVYDLHKYNGINAGNYMIRNCQWSLDLIDRWASFGASEQLQVENGKMMSEFLDRPSEWAADDQSTLVYMLLTETEKYALKVYFESSIVMSGQWTYWSRVFVDEYKLRVAERPFVTHFAGCHPCTETVGDKRCLVRMDKTLNYADNQVLESYGLRHERLNSSLITGKFLGEVQEWTYHDIESFLNVATEDLELRDEAKEAKVAKLDEEDATRNKSAGAKEENDSKQQELNSTAKGQEDPESDRGKEELDSPTHQESNSTAKEESDKINGYSEASKSEEMPSTTAKEGTQERVEDPKEVGLGAPKEKVDTRKEQSSTETTVGTP